MFTLVYVTFSFTDYSERENCVERALKYLLHHGLWSEAVELLKEQIRNEGLPKYMHITMKALAEVSALLLLTFLKVNIVVIAYACSNSLEDL